MGLSKDEVTLLKQAREIGDILSTSGYSELKRILLAQIETRTRLVLDPAHLLDDATAVAGGQRLDGMTRFGAVEHIKGVIYGLRLALDTPETIMAEAKRLRDREDKRGGEAA
jgi:hypothetical protein